MPAVRGDAVIDVDDEVARLQPLEQVLGHDPTKDARPTDTHGAEELTIGDQRPRLPGRRRSPS